MTKSYVFTPLNIPTPAGGPIQGKVTVSIEDKCDP